MKKAPDLSALFKNQSETKFKKFSSTESKVQH